MSQPIAIHGKVFRVHRAYGNCVDLARLADEPFAGKWAALEALWNLEHAVQWWMLAAHIDWQGFQAKGTGLAVAATHPATGPTFPTSNPPASPDVLAAPGSTLSATIAKHTQDLLPKRPVRDEPLLVRPPPR